MDKLITLQHINAVVFDFGVVFYLMRSRMLAVMRSNMGCAASDRGKPLCGVLGQHADNEASSNSNFMKNPKNQGLRKMAKFISVGAPILIFVFFGGSPGFCQNRVFENQQIFVETIVNVVPNGRGCKTHFCKVGSEIGHVRSGSNMVPKYFLNWHFLSHSPSRRQGELFFLALSLLEHRSLSIFLMVAFCSAITISVIFYFVSFLLFLLVVFVFFVGVSASDYIPSFIILISLLLSCFSSCFIFYVLRSMFCFPFVCLSLLLFIFLFFCVSLCDSPILFLCFCSLFDFRISFEYSCFVFFLLVPPLSHFLCFSPGPYVRLKRKTMEKTTISFCLPFGGSLRKCLLRKIIVYFVIWWIFCPQHVFC